jgi:hypothetical protein
MGDPVISLNRTNVKTSSDQYMGVRFIYIKGRAAVWQENKKAGTADRVLYSTQATLVKPDSARHPMQIITPDSTWEIRQQSTGCGCGSRLKRLPLSQLLDPDFNHFG